MTLMGVSSGQSGTNRSRGARDRHGPGRSGRSGRSGARRATAAGAAAGDASRFESLWAQWHERVRRYIARRCSFDDVEDVLANTFTVAWRRLEVIPEGEAALWWLLATARGVLANFYRSQRRGRQLVERVGTMGGAVDREAQDSVNLPPGLVSDPLVDAALGSLRSEDREVLTLSIWDELSAAEIGAVLSISAEAAQKRLSRARERFREQYLALSQSGPSRTLLQ